MLREGRPDLVAAFPGGRGTAHMVRIAREAGVEVVHMIRATSDRVDRLRPSLRRLGYDLKAAERRARFQIRREGTKVDETVGLDLAGVERWIRERAKG
jgi:hypothetical protein